MAHPIRKHLEDFRARKTELFHKDFLLTWEHPRQEIEAILSLAAVLKGLHQEGISYRAFDSGLAISIFRDNSTRTRFSFASAADALGFGLADLDEEKSQIAHGETVRETANMISFLAEVIGIRDDIFLGEGNKYMREVGAALTEGAQRGRAPPPPQHREPPVRRRPPHPEPGRPGLAEGPLRRAGPAPGEEAGHDLGVQPELRQAALGAPGRHRPHDPLRHGGRPGPPRGLRPHPRGARGREEERGRERRGLPGGGLDGGGVPRRRRGLPEVVGPLPRHAAAHPAAAEGRQAGAGGAGEGVPGQQRALRRLAVRPGQDGSHP